MRVVAKSTMIVVLLALMLAPSMLLADDPAGDAKRGAEILDEFVEATGGQAAYDKIETRYQIGKMIMPAMNMQINTEIWAAKPNLVYMKAFTPEIGNIERGFNGEVFWENSMLTGPRILTGPELAEAKIESNFDAMARWREVYKSALYVGDDSVNGKLCRQVVVTSPEGKDQSLFFDADSHLLVKVMMVSETQQGSIPIAIYPSDYREIDGIMFSFKSTMNLMNQERVIALDSVAQNIELPEGVFDLPPAIIELQKAQEAAPAPEEETDE